MPLHVLLLVVTSAAATLQASEWALALESPQIGGITAFAARDDGTLFACKTNGNDPQAGWTATSHGKPGGGAIGHASGHFHSTNTDLYVFTRTQNGNLFVRTAPQVFNNSNPAWTWIDLGKPAAASIASDPESISHLGKEYAFVIGGDRHLHAVSGPAWVWSDHGTPGVLLGGRPETLIFADSLYLFVIGSDGKLYQRRWNGVAWTWTSHGMPGGAPLRGSVAASTSGSTIQVFARGSDQRLYLRSWNGFAWQWSDQGDVAAGIGAPDAATFGAGSNGLDLYAFALHYTSELPLPTLLENHRSPGGIWELVSHGAPAQALLFGQPSIAGSFTGPTSSGYAWRVNVFVTAQGNRIHRRIHAPAPILWLWQWSPQYCQM